MNWSRTKTWLIVLFIGINLFLIFTLVKENIAQSTISEKMVADTVAILARNGITIDEQIIPRKMPALSAVAVHNSIANQKTTAESMLGGKPNYKPDDNQYMRSTSVVQFSGDTFNFHNINPAQKNLYKNPEEATAYAKAFLEKAGMNTDKAQITIVSDNGGEIKLLFTQRLDSYPLMDSQLEVTVTPGGISTASGCWFYMADEQSGRGSAGGRVKEITSVLIDFISDSYRAGSSTQITDITLGYTTGNKSSYHKSVSAMPSWRITTSDGRVYYYDAN